MKYHNTRYVFNIDHYFNSLKTHTPNLNLQSIYVVISLILSPFPSVSPMGTKVLHTVQSSDRHYILVCIVALFGPQNTFRCLQNYIFYYLHLAFSLVLYSLHLMAGIRYNILIWYRPLCDVAGDIHSAASFDRNDRYNYGYIIIRQWNRCPINIPRLCETHFICQLLHYSATAAEAVSGILKGSFFSSSLCAHSQTTFSYREINISITTAYSTTHDWWHDRKLNLISHTTCCLWSKDKVGKNTHSLNALMSDEITYLHINTYKFSVTSWLAKSYHHVILFMAVESKHTFLVE